MGRTARQVEEMVAGQQPGDQPGDLADPSLRRHVLRLEVSAETFATFREAMQSFVVRPGNHSRMTPRCCC